MNLATILLGPLAGPECRRALARGWLIVVRTLVGLLPAAIVVFLIWIWWFAQVNPTHSSIPRRCCGSRYRLRR